ncbi:hypothetical protein L7F22_016871 [Adiantum nelumboides]|nr:hypothetical protein [Adiantum nelumboides]
MKDLGELRYFLGMKIVDTLSGIWMIQRQYALDMLEKYKMTACKPIDTPLDQNVKLVDDGHYIDDVTMYRKMVVSLIYLTITRPDLSYAVGVVSQFMQKPCKSHLDAVRQIMRYVKATVNYGMFYEKNAKLYLYGYTDADWAGDFMDRRSTSGYAFSIGNGMISWSSKKQPTVALSSTEAEYRGAALATCEESWLRALMADFGFDNVDSVTIYCDNISSIMLAKNPVYHAPTKHIEVHYHFIREKVLATEIDLVYVKTNDQVADIFTKALGKEKFCYFCEALETHHMQAHFELEGKC